MQKGQAPRNQILLDHDIDDRLRHCVGKLSAVLGTHLLENRDVESLSNGPILLLFEGRDYLLEDAEIHCSSICMSEILHTLGSAHDHGDER